VGAQPVFPPNVVVDVKRLACELPLVPLCPGRPSRVLVGEISEVTRWRWPRADALQPWRHRTWIFPGDPDFAEKAGRVLDLYEGKGDGTLWGQTNSCSRQTKNRVSRRAAARTRRSASSRTDSSRSKGAMRKRPRPFQWTFTRVNLAALLAKLKAKALGVQHDRRRIRHRNCETLH
jgi:hypothetical protein